jgi:hypothetical protein
MPTVTSITTTYAGEFASKYIAAALLTSNTIEQGLIEVKPNIKYKQVVKKLAVGDILADESCDFTPTSTVTLTERILQPKELQVNLQLCKKDFESDWDAISMGYSSHDTLPKSFADFLVAHVAAKVAAKNETNIWQGDESNSGEFDGFETLLANDANLVAAQEVTGTTVDAGDVITEMGKVVDAIPARLYGQPGLQIYVSQNIMKAYVRALGGFGASGLGANGTGGNGTQWYNGSALSFDGIPVVMAQGMSDNTMIATTKDNLWFGTGLLADHNEVKVIDMADIDGSQNVRIVMRLSAGVQYANVEDIVTYGIANSLVS